MELNRIIVNFLPTLTYYFFTWSVIADPLTYSDERQSEFTSKEYFIMVGVKFMIHLLRGNHNKYNIQVGILCWFDLCLYIQVISS